MEQEEINDRKKKKNCLHQDSIIRTNVRESSNVRDMKW